MDGVDDLLTIGSVLPLLRLTKGLILARGAAQVERQIAASWGASTYRHGGLMSGIEHIMYRHGFNSGFSNVSRFARGTRVRDISNYVDAALRYGRVTSAGPGAYIVEGNIGRVIGTDIAGKGVSNIRVIVRDGIIQTAFPF
jgi:filamentous hemagglutinin